MGDQGLIGLDGLPLADAARGPRYADVNSLGQPKAEVKRALAGRSVSLRCGYLTPLLADLDLGTALADVHFEPAMSTGTPPGDDTGGLRQSRRHKIKAPIVVKVGGNQAAVLSSGRREVAAERELPIAQVAEPR